MYVSLFGSLAVIDGQRSLRGNDLGGAKPRGLLELLLLARGRVVTKDALADALWGSAPPNNVAGTLEQYVCLVRHRVFQDSLRSRRVLVTEPNAYRFDTSEVVVDLDEFDTLLRRAEYADTDRRRRLTSEAVGMAKSDLLEDAPYSPWTVDQRELYRGRVARAHLWLGTDGVATGDYAGAVRHGQEALRSAPYSEQAYRTIMVADHALGHDDLARSTFHRCIDVLATELRLDPSTETVMLAGAIDAGAPSREVIDEFLSPSRSREQMLTAS